MKHFVRTSDALGEDLTLSSSSLADKCAWKVLNDDLIGSDHYPIVTGSVISVVLFNKKGALNRCLAVQTGTHLDECVTKK